jgi:hypothetical protein
VSGFVYFIAAEPHSFVKIGWSKRSPLGRMVTLQTGCPQPLDLLACFPGTQDDERRLHRTFAALRFRGEWFFHQHKLKDLTWFLNNEFPNGNPFASRSAFEDATWDVLITGYTHPDMPDEAAYLESGDGSLWRFLHAEMAE